MDAFRSSYHHIHGQRPDLEEYEQAINNIHHHSSFGAPQLTPVSSVEEVGEHCIEQAGTISPAQVNTQQQAQYATMDRRFSQQAPPHGMTPDSQNGESSFCVHPQAGSMLSEQMQMHHGLVPQQQNHHQQQPPVDWSSVFTANAEEAASLQLPNQNFLESFMGTTQHNLNHALQHQSAARGPQAPEGVMSTLNSPMDNGLGPAAELAAMDTFTRGMLQGGAQHMGQADDEEFMRHEQALLAQPMAVHGSGMHKPSHASQLHAQVERMMQSPPTHFPPEMRRTSGQESTTISEDANLNLSHSSDDFSPSPSSAAESHEHVSELGFGQHSFMQDSRRPSMTTDLARNMTNVHLQASQSSEDLSNMQSLFRKPSLPQVGRSTLAERRKQQLPIGINTQRQRGTPINRAFSSSAINQMAQSPRYPTSPLHSLRRNKSSNVVLGGRIQKPANASSRNSPRLGSFSEASLQSSQVTPQPPSTNMQGNAQASLAPPSPLPQLNEPQEMMPPSASTALFTPGIYSGSVPNYSFQNTPVTNTPNTTPYGFGPQQHLFHGHGFPPASDMPQSAPAHMLSFNHELSPTAMPSMSPTPANHQFPQTPHQMHMYHAAPMHHAMPVVPSQPGIPEQMGFIPHNPDMIHAGIHPMMYMSDADSAHLYEQQRLWVLNNTNPVVRQMDFKLDGGTERIKEELKSGRVTLCPITTRDIGFQNVSFYDLKHQLENPEKAIAKAEKIEKDEN